MNPTESANAHKKYNIVGLLRVKARVLAIEKISASFQFLLHADLVPDNEGHSFFASIIAKIVEETLLATEPELLKIFYEYLGAGESISDVILEECIVVLDNVTGVGDRFAGETEALIKSGLDFGFSPPFNFDIDELFIEHLPIIDSPYSFYPSYRSSNDILEEAVLPLDSVFGSANDKISYNAFIQENGGARGFLEKVAPGTHYIFDKAGATGPLEYKWKVDEELEVEYWDQSNGVEDSFIKDKMSGKVGNNEVIPFFRKTFYLERFIDVEFEDGSKWVVNFDYFVQNSYIAEQEDKLLIQLSPDPSWSGGDTEQLTIMKAAVGLRLMVVPPTLSAVKDTPISSPKQPAFAVPLTASDKFSELQQTVGLFEAAQSADQKATYLSEINEILRDVIDEYLTGEELLQGKSPYGHFTEKTWEHARKNKEYFRMEVVNLNLMPKEFLDWSGFEANGVSKFLDEDALSEINKGNDPVLFVYHPIEIARTTVLESDLMESGTFEAFTQAAEDLFYYWKEGDSNKFETDNGKKSIFNYLKYNNPNLITPGGLSNLLSDVGDWDDTDKHVKYEFQGLEEEPFKLTVYDSIYKYIYKTTDEEILWNQLTNLSLSVQKDTSHHKAFSWAPETKDVLEARAIDGLTEKFRWSMIDYHDVAANLPKHQFTHTFGRIKSITNNLNKTVEHMKGTRLTTEELTFFGGGNTPPKDLDGDGAWESAELVVTPPPEEGDPSLMTITPNGFKRDWYDVVHNWEMENWKTGVTHGVGPSYDCYGWLNTFRLAEDLKELKNLLDNHKEKLASASILAFDREKIKAAFDAFMVMLIQYEEHFCKVLEGSAPGGVKDPTIGPPIGSSPWPIPEMGEFPMMGGPVYGPMKVANGYPQGYLGTLGFLKRRISEDVESWNHWPVILNKNHKDSAIWTQYLTPQKVNSWVQAYWDAFPRQSLDVDVRTDVLPPAFFNVLLGPRKQVGASLSDFGDDPHVLNYPEAWPWFANTTHLRDFKKEWFKSMTDAIGYFHTWDVQEKDKSYAYHLFYSGEIIRDFYKMKTEFQKYYDLFNKPCASDVENKNILVGLSNFNPVLKKRLVKTDEFQYFFRYVVPLQLVSTAYGAFFLERSKVVESVEKAIGNYSELSAMITKMTNILHNLTKPIARPPDWSSQT